MGWNGSMVDGPTTIRDAKVRRGVVLGLTLGEAILLILFSLLLALAVPLIDQAKKNQELEREFERVRTAAETKSATLEEIIKKIELATPGKGIEDLTKEYVLMSERIKSLEAKLKEQEKAAAAFQYLVEAVKSDAKAVKPGSEMDMAKEMAAESTANRQFRDTVSEILSQNGSTGDLSQLQQALREMAADAQKGQLSGLTHEALIERLAQREGELKQAQRELSNTKGQLENVRRQFSQSGRGVEAVPCWPTPSGKEEYIFDVALTNSGFIIRDRKLPHRQEEQSKLPLNQIVFERELTPTRFLAAAKPLFDWSVEHNCRFFVYVYDQTGATEKTIYKRHRRYLGARFYFYEIRDEPF